jgi:hypothetical protein
VGIVHSIYEGRIEGEREKEKVEEEKKKKKGGKVEVVRMVSGLIKIKNR